MTTLSKRAQTAIQGYCRNFRSMLAISVAVTLLGCNNSKTLTPSTAKNLLEQRLSTERDLAVNYSPIASLIGHKTFADYQEDQYATRKNASAALHQLLKAGLAQRIVAKTSYPNLSGSYTGEGWYSAAVVIVMQPGSPLISGTYERDICKGRISGTLTGDGGVTITYAGTGSGPCSNTYSSTYKIQQTNDGVRLVYPSINGHLHTKTLSMPSMELTAYSYVLLPGFLKLVDANGDKVTVGTIQVDDVTDLLLEGTDTAAEGNYTWHLDPNEVGKAILDAGKTKGSGRVFYRKQPDGEWVCVNVTKRSLSGMEMSGSAAAFYAAARPWRSGRKSRSPSAVLGAGSRLAQLPSDKWPAGDR